MSLFQRSVTLAAVGLWACSSAVLATPYTVSYLDGGSWNTVYVQGFSTSLGAIPDPGLSDGDPVYLDQFEFFKSGNSDSASNIQLAILNNIFVDMSGGLSTSHSAFVGFSSNTIASTAGIATDDPIVFNFNSLPLVYGDDYAAVFVNVGVGGELTPVLVSALTANYVDVGGGDFHPDTNYGAENEFIYATSNFIQNGFFFTFSYAGDANFRATLNTVPEPGSAALALSAVGVLMLRRRCRGEAH